MSKRPLEHIVPPAAASPLGRIATASAPDPQLSGFRLLASGWSSLNTRLALIERAQSSVDLQVYQFKGDASGRRVMRALRDAAARGVRVRVLVDDFYTTGDDLLLLGLAAFPGVSVRLFNPFSFGRDSVWARMASAMFGAERLHRRMHNKLMVADGVLAIAGGRNIADEYFDGQGDQIFFDFDVLAAGAVVPQLARTLDPYWNSSYSHDVRVVLGEGPGTDSLRQAFDEQVDPVGCLTAACGDDSSLRPAAHDASAGLAEEFAHGLVRMHSAQATAAADAPEKIEAAPTDDLVAVASSGAEVRLRVALSLRQAREQVTLVSPYLIPGPSGVETLRAFRQRGVRVTLLTNSLAATDEPLVHVGYRRYRAALLREGVDLYEWSPVRSGRVFRQVLGGKAVLRLHAKCAVIDDHHVYIGSMNFDPRSRNLNTEFGLLIHSTELAAQVLALIDRMKREGSYRVVLDADGETLRWTSGDIDGGDELDTFEPGTDFWSRLMLDLLAPFVPEELL